MKQPYIYTLPEAFIEDKSVPLHWKLYALINGFWIAGKPVFASNHFFAEKLGCTERYIQICLEKLEKLETVQRIGISQNRTIVPWGTNHEFVGGRTDSSKGDEPAVHHISDSNADSIISVADAPRIEVVEEVQEERPKSKPKYPNARPAFKWFPEYESWWDINTTQLKYGEMSFVRGEKSVRGILSFLSQYKDMEDCPQVITPYDLETKWKKVEAFAKRNGI